MSKAAVVLTTIFDPVVLDGYYTNFKQHGHLEDVEIFVIPDRKTPSAALDTCHRLNSAGLKIRVPSLQEQDAYLKRLGLDPSFIPFNSDNRRNIGFLMAMERDIDFLISLDDDNYCLPNSDYFAEHARVLQGPVRQDLSSARNGFLNIGDLLHFDTPATVYPRGYPYFARHEASPVTTRDAEVDVMINSGLWLTDPDVDAITWLGLKPRSRGFSGCSVVLDDDTWSPVNSQNTALRADLMPSYYFVRMGYPLQGLHVDRYGDIFSGYFALACAKQLGGSARFGTPIADHRRNRHDYLRDASAEWNAILLLEDILHWLKGATLQGSDSFEAYLSLAYGLEEAVERFDGPCWTDAARGFFHQMAFCMRTWTTACRQIAPRRQMKVA